MSIAAGAERKDRRWSIRPLLEPLLFGLATFGVISAGRLIAASTPQMQDDTLTRLLLVALSVIPTAGVACLAYAAGLRRSLADLLATLAVFVAYVAYAWGPWSP
jgi:hypothetical protein